MQQLPGQFFELGLLFFSEVVALFLDGEVGLCFARRPPNTSSFQAYRVGCLFRLCDRRGDGKRTAWVGAVRDRLAEVVKLGR
ncbi:hypothetical protein D9M73_248850 [compost metagenome]